MCLLRLDYYELHPMDEKMVNDFYIKKWKWIIYVIHAKIFYELKFSYVVEAFLTLDIYIYIYFYILASH